MRPLRSQPHPSLSLLAEQKQTLSKQLWEEEVATARAVDRLATVACNATAGQPLNVFSSSATTMVTWQVDDTFSQLRWSWREQLMLDEIVEIGHVPGQSSVAIGFWTATADGAATNLQHRQTLQLLCHSVGDASSEREACHSASWASI